MIDDAVAGCYVHLPFCDRICPYCDFAVVQHAQPRTERYLRALLAEIERTGRPRYPVKTIYLGGGTPSALASDQLQTLLTALYLRHDIAAGSAECTIEANPSRGTSDIAAWRAAGVTRLSVGVQSFDDGDLHHLGRDHTAAQAVEFVTAARRVGMDDISVDLIGGAPGQTPTSFARTIKRALAEMEPDHISVYGLTIEPGTPYAAWKAREPSAFPDDDAVAEMLIAAAALLTAAGFEHYELSNFARPGHRCQHNIGYWRQRDCVAYGMSAAGYDDGERYRNLRDYTAYCRAIEAGASAHAETERLDFAPRVGEAAMLALRTAAGIEDEDFQRRFGVDPAAVFADARKKCSDAGLLETDAVGARLTPRGRLLANDVCAEFLTPHIDAPVATGAGGLHRT